MGPECTDLFTTKTPPAICIQKNSHNVEFCRLCDAAWLSEIQTQLFILLMSEAVRRQDTPCVTNRIQAIFLAILFRL